MALTEWWKNPNAHVVKDPTGNIKMSVGDRMAAETNAARREKLGTNPERLYGSNGYTYSRGR
jgi:hypothetical protein